MYKALVIKELRESAGVVALAVVAAAYVLTSLIGLPLLPVDIVRENGYPFVGDSFRFYMSLVVGGLAIALGLKQTVRESATYAFLLHRPVSRKVVFGAKLVVGVSLVLILGAVFVMIYASWVATPGHVAWPFFWSMTIPTWQLLFCMPLLYLGGFLSGLRPGRWFGTRLAPLVTAGLMTLVLCWFWWWWLTLATAIMLAFIGLAAIFYYVYARDY